MYKIFHNDILRMKKIVNKTRKGTAGSSFASAVNFVMIVDQCTNPVFPSFERKQPFLICVKPLFKGKVTICQGGGDSHIKVTGILLSK